MADFNPAYVGDPLAGADTQLYKHKTNLLAGGAAGAGTTLLLYMLQSKKKSRLRRLLNALLGGVAVGGATTGVMYGLNKLTGTNYSHRYRLPDAEAGESPDVAMYVSGSGAGAWEGEAAGNVRRNNRVNGEGRTLIVNPHDMGYAEDYLRRLKEKYPNARVRITGHSHGGAAAMDLASYALDKGITVDRLDTVDPIFRFTRPDKKLSGRLDGRWNNYYATKANWRYLPDLWAILGGRHEELAGANNIAVSDNRYNNHTDIMRLPQFSGRDYREQELNDADNPKYWWWPYK